VILPSPEVVLAARYVNAAVRGGGPWCSLAAVARRSYAEINRGIEDSPEALARRVRVPETGEIQVFERSEHDFPMRIGGRRVLLKSGRIQAEKAHELGDRGGGGGDGER